MLCNFQHCERSSVAKGLCPTHYRRLRRYGDPAVTVRTSVAGKICNVMECLGPVVSRDLCKKHYTKWQRYKDPLFSKNLPPGSEPYDSILKYGVLRMDECLIYQGGTNGAPGYGLTYGNLLAHRVSYEKFHGPIPQGMQIDHTCHNEAARLDLCAGGKTCIHRLCVNPGHLMAVSHRQNGLNSPLAGGKTHCKRGHLYTEENTYTRQPKNRPGPCRRCRTCQRELWQRNNKP
jgi:hypothetical protein